MGKTAFTRLIKRQNGIMIYYNLIEFPKLGGIVIISPVSTRASNENGIP